MPLLIRGARQIGKTFVIKSFGEQHFDNVVTINFEQQPEYQACFDTLYPDTILNKIYILSQQKITPGKTLLFLDEIQDCPNALLALRYFYEQKAELHVIAAGSLLEFTLRNEDFRMPVGRVQSLYMYPLSFKEFLIASKQEPLLDYLMQLTIFDTVDPVFEVVLQRLLKEYWVLGGMPAVVKTYLDTHDLHECDIRQSAIINGYRGDFGKYASKSNVRYLQRLFEKAPGLIAKHFQYSAIDAHMQSRDIKNAVADLVDAGVINSVHATKATLLPLISTINEKKFKLLFLDIGLVVKSLGIQPELMMNDELILINQGALAEQFVGQELIAYTSPYEKNHLYYWERERKTSMAEVEYVSHYQTTIFPIEVKSGSTGRLKSIQLFLDEKHTDLGVRISQAPLGLHNRILSIPFYLIFRLDELVASALEQKLK